MSDPICTVDSASADERWIITGASGQLGGHVVSLLASARAAGRVLALAGAGAVGVGVEVRRIPLQELVALRACVRSWRPTHVVHLGAMTAVSDAFARPDEAHAINTVATRVLAEETGACGGRFVFSSTDMVFDGNAAPYRETDAPSPPSVYGRTKVAAERAIVGMPHALAIRIPLMFGIPVAKTGTTFAAQLAALRSGRPLKLFTDEHRTPIWLFDAARAVIALARSDETGLIHVAGPERLSRLEMIERVARLLAIHEPKLEPISRLAISSAEPRPADLSLDGSRFLARFPQLAPQPMSAAMLR
ncbi:dTDP-4-dehydrorhamnose reductase [Phycisphaerae bacterium RAS1]|nr:dTDP-4-dehydrorhamnose reductase [Phycisphaerae bacterium RAS1]